jgi:hypothetical protein
MVLLALQQFRQLGDLGVFRGVTDGVAEEARTHGFPCLLSLGLALSLLFKISLRPHRSLQAYV